MESIDKLRKRSDIFLPCRFAEWCVCDGLFFDEFVDFFDGAIEVGLRFFVIDGAANGAYHGSHAAAHNGALTEIIVFTNQLKQKPAKPNH